MAMRKMIFIIKVFYKNGNTDKIALEATSWSDATEKAHHYLVGNGEYNLQHESWGYLCE